MRQISASLVFSVLLMGQLHAEVTHSDGTLDGRFLPPQIPIPADAYPIESEPTGPAPLLFSTERSDVAPAFTAIGGGRGSPAVVTSAPTATVSPTLPSPVESYIEPDHQGVIQLGASGGEMAGAGTNPFDFRVRAIETSRSTRLRVGGVLGGKRPSAILNGRTVVKGDRVEGFGIVLITKEGVVVERSGQFLRLQRGKETVVVEGTVP